MNVHKLRPSLAAVALLFQAADLHAEDDALQLRQQPALLYEFPSDEATPAFISADRVSGRKDDVVEAEGKVEVRKRGQIVEADHVIYHQAEDEVDADGHVRIEQEGSSASGPELHMKLGTREGYMRTPSYQLAQPNAHGTAENLTFAGKDKYLISDGTYTTCGPGNDDWFLRTKKMELDRTTQTGTASSASVYFKGVPFLYTPWLTFPLNNQRRSGFLPPSFTSSGRSGTGFSIPYYWNIAPERDATFTAGVLSKRGVVLNAEYRYLAPSYAGENHVEALPNDTLAGRGRYALTLRHSQSLGAGWGGGWDIQKASDDAYFRDLTTSITSTAQTFLPRAGMLVFNGLGMNFQARVQHYQTLQDPLAPVTPPYGRSPQLQLNGAWPVVSSLNLGLNTEWVDFTHPTMVNGRRFTLYPSLSLPLHRSYGFVTPKIGLHTTRYVMGENNTAGLEDATRRMPIFSIDSGLFYDRDTSMNGKDYIQTLEPRVYYLNIPYRDQSRLPNFDSAQADFNYAQMFTENQFVGGDRINDANQVTMALTSRFIDRDTGQERLRATVGQRYYFRDQQVSLDGTTRTDKSSDVLAAFSGRVAHDWSVDTGLQYNAGERAIEKAGVSLRFQPAPAKVVNMGYRYTRDPQNALNPTIPIKQMDFSTQWPMYGRWQGVGRWNYSFLDSKVLEGLAGVEYNGGCWAARVVLHRFATATAQMSNSVFFQLELFGLGRVGSNPLDLLKRNISGFVQTNQLTAPATTHETY